MKTTEIIWLMGIFVSLGAIFTSLHLSPYPISTAASYKALLPSITYIAVSTSFISLIEALELLDRGKSDGRTDEDRKKFLILACLVGIASLAFFSVYAKNVEKASDPNYLVTWPEILLNLVMIAVAGFLAFQLKRNVDAE